jgi:hypothetical protein
VSRGVVVDDKTGEVEEEEDSIGNFFLTCVSKSSNTING